MGVRRERMRGRHCSDRRDKESIRLVEIEKNLRERETERKRERERGREGEREGGRARRREK